VADAERGMVLGSPSYLSPEVASGNLASADARSDVFALGVILYEVLAGRKPFAGATPVRTVEAIRSGHVVDPRRVQRHVPRELAAICLKALSKDPAGRYSTAREFAQDLRNYRNFLPISAVEPTLRERAVKWMRRHPRATTAIATFVAALVVFGSLRVYRIAGERAAVEAFWTQYEAIAADVTRLQSELERSTRAPSSGASAGAAAMAELELRERLRQRTNDARSIAAAMLALTRGRPDPRIVSAVTARVRADVAEALAQKDFVRAKVLAEARLALLRQFEGQLTWPPEEVRFLETTRDQAVAELERRAR
jgi:hypothetical protein